MTDLNKKLVLENELSEHHEKVGDKSYSLTDQGVKEETIIFIKDSVSSFLPRIVECIKNNREVTGISTALFDLDRKISGFQNSELIIIGSRPSIGKTAFALHLAYNACKSLQTQTKSDTRQAVVFFSLESSSDVLTERLLSMLAGIDSTRLKKGKINEEEYNKLREASKELSEMNLHIDSTPALTITQLKTRARKLKRKYNVGIIFIDYLQLLRGTGERNNRILEITEISRELKSIAMELNIPVIALSQLSRALEQREDKWPMLSDLRESGSIEQDADIVMFIYREEYYLKRKEPQPSDPKYTEWLSQLVAARDTAEIIIAKHRNGTTGNIKLFYDERLSRFEDFRFNLKQQKCPRL